MQQALLVGREVFLIFIYVGIGMMCAKKELLSDKTGRDLSNFTMIIVVPVLIVRYYMRPMSGGNLSALGITFLLALIYYIMASFLCVFLIKKRESPRYRIERFGAVFSNCGYMAVPLMRAAIGENGVFYSLAFISMFNICVWTIGITVLTGEKQREIRKAFLNPGFIATAIGVLLFFTQLPVPDIILEAMDNIVIFNTPLPMMVTGIYLAKINFRETFSDLRIYYTSFVRLIAVPLVMTAIVIILKVSSWVPGASDVVLAILLCSACPAAAATTLMPARYKLESEYGAKLIAVSTLLSILTLPLITFIAKLAI